MTQPDEPTTSRPATETSGDPRPLNDGPGDPTGAWTASLPELPDAAPAELPAAAPAGGGPGALAVALAAIALLAGAALFLSGYSLGNRAAATPGTPVSDASLFRPFWDVWDSITHSYAGGDVDRQELVQGAISGLFEALGDPYSGYMSPEDLRQAREDIGGQFEGIGATIGTTGPGGEDSSCAVLGADCRMVVIRPMSGSPAERAGLTAGDVITNIDGAAVDGLGLDEAIRKVRGPKGSTVVLTVERNGAAPIEISIVRDTIIASQIVTQDVADGAVRYIRIAGFSDHAARDFTDAVRAGLAAGQQAFIIDLRDNPGGLVTAARTIASQFVASGPIFWEEDASGHQEPTDAQADGVATADGIRVAVLVNKGSASASEIVAGALQDTGRAILVGETTYGKGTVQEWVDLTAEAGGFRLTIAKWLTPNKRWIHQTGLTPDVVVATDGPATEPTGDPYIDAAITALGSGSALRFSPRADAAWGAPASAGSTRTAGLLRAT